MSKQLSVPEFANTIRSKYNAYGDVPDEKLVNSFLEKYPVYQDRVSFDPIVEEKVAEEEAVVETPPVGNVVEAEQVAIEDASGETAQQVEEDEVGLDLGNVAGSVASGAGQNILGATAGASQVVSDIGSFDTKNPLQDEAMRRAVMMDPRGSMMGFNIFQFGSPKEVQELADQPDYTQEYRDERKRNVDRSIGEIRNFSNDLDEYFGVDPEFANSYVGGFLKATGDILTTIVTTGKTLWTKAYDGGIRRSEEFYNKPYSEFTKEEKQNVRLANSITASGIYVLEKFGLKGMGAGKLSKWIDGKVKIKGDVLARLFQYAKQGTAEGAEEFIEPYYSEAVAKYFYDHGTEIFTYDRFIEALTNASYGQILGTSISGVQNEVNILRANSNKTETVQEVAQIEDPEVLASVIKKPKVTMSYNIVDPTGKIVERRTTTVFADNEADAKQRLGEAIVQENKDNSTNNFVEDIVVNGTQNLKTETKEGKTDPYTPIAVPPGMDRDEAEAMQQQVKDTIDREGEAGIPDLVETANELAGTGVAGYIQAEADNYVSYKKEQTGKDKLEPKSQEELLADEKQAQDSEKAREAIILKTKDGKELLKLKKTQEKLADEQLQLREDTDNVLQDPNLTTEQRNKQVKALRKKQQKVDRALAVVDTQTASLENAVAEQAKEVERKEAVAKQEELQGKGRSFLGKLLGDLAVPVTEALERINPSIKRLFRQFERQSSTRILNYQMSLSDGFKTLKRIKKKSPATYNRLVQLMSMTVDSSNEATQELQDTQEAVEEQIIPVDNNFVSETKTNNINNNREQTSTILDQYGNPTTEGTRLPLPDPRPQEQIDQTKDNTPDTTATTSNIKGAKLPKFFGKPKLFYGRTEMNFESDVDRALYIVRPGGKSKHKARYMQWLKDTLGLPQSEILQLSQETVAIAKSAGAQARANGKSQAFIRSNGVPVQETKPDNYLAQLSDSAKNAFKFVRTQFPGVEIVVGGSLAETRAQIVQKLRGKLGLRRAQEVANSFTDMDRGQAVFVGNKPVAIVINDAMAQSNTVAHETWELILNEAFKNDPKRLKELQQAVDKQLRDSGFGLLANKLKAFADQYDGDLRYSEYLAEFGATLIDGGFNPNALSQKQKGLMTQIKKIINGFSRVLVGKPMFLADATSDNVMSMFVSVSSKVATGKPVNEIKPDENDLGDDPVRTSSQLDTRLTQPGVEVDKKELISIKAGANPQETMAKVSALLDRFPNALSDETQWVNVMSRLNGARQVDPNTGEIQVPKFPLGLSKLTTVEGVKQELQKVSKKQRDLATQGLKEGQKIRKMYEAGQMNEVDTSMYFFWNIMSIGISPYPQESGFLIALDNGITNWVQKARKNEFDLDSYYTWVDKILPKGTPGSGAKSNLRSFGSSFLSQAGDIVPDGEFEGMTKLGALHQILSDKDTPTVELRKKWQSFATGMSFNNKIFDFILLTTGRQDLYVIDRVRTEEFWDKNTLLDSINVERKHSIYDGNEFTYKKSKGAGYSKVLNDITGMVINELAIRETSATVTQAYEELGVKEIPTVGRFHWETWVASSAQEVSHGSIDAVLQTKQYDAIIDAGIRQGKYGSWDFNFTYRKEKGKPFMFEFIDNDGNVYIFENIRDIYNEITRQNTKKTDNPTDPQRFILKDSNGQIIKKATDKTENLNGAWYDQSGVDTQAYFKFLESQATEVRPSSDVINDQGIVVKRQRSYNKPLPGVTRTGQDPDFVLGINETDRDNFRSKDPETGMPRTTRRRDYVLAVDAQQLKELELALLEDPNNKELQSRVQAKRESYRAKAGLVPGSAEVVMPINVFEKLPKVPSLKEVSYALDSGKVRTGPNPILGVNTEIADGTPVSMRLDIPAYNKFDTYVVTLHDGTTEMGDVLGYAPFGRIKNVSFYSVPDGAINIATGKGKSTIARMHGSFVNDNRNEILDEAEALLDGNNEWIQVGMNPERASYFYNKETGRPVIEATEVIQVGALVLAKNATEVNPDNPRAYQRFSGGRVRVRYQKTDRVNAEEKAKLIQERDDLLRRNGLYDWYHKDMRKTMDQLYDEATGLGIKIDYLTDYYPRKIKDFKGMMKYLGLDNQSTEALYEEVRKDRRQKAVQLIKDQREALGRELTQDEQQAIVEDNNLGELQDGDKALVLENYFRRNFNALPSSAKTPGNIKARDLEIIPEDLLKFYEDPLTAFDQYLFDMVNAIETKKLIGSRSAPDGGRIAGTLGYELAKLQSQGRLSLEDLKQVQKTVTDIFGSKTQNAVENQLARGMRQIAYITLLSDIGATITQLKDTAVNFFRFGTEKTLKGLGTKKRVVLEEIGKAGSYIAPELESGGKGFNKFLQKGQDFLHTINVFRRADKFLKESSMNTSFISMQKDARADKNSDAYKNLVSKLKFIQGNDYIYTIAGLKADKVNDFVLEAIYNDLADTQPIGRFEMPLKYNREPGSRILYTLRSFSVVLLSFARRKAINKIIPEITTGRKGNLATRIEGLEELVRLMFFMTIIGTGADVVRKFVRGQPIYLDDLAFDNALQIFMINRYNIRDFGENGLVTGLMNFITPAGFSIFDTLGRALEDTSELLKLAPAGIKEWFYYRGPNADKRNLKEIQRKMKGETFPDIQRYPSFDDQVYPRGGGFLPEPFEPKKDTRQYYR
jgi:hypothetical protein